MASKPTVMQHCAGLHRIEGGPATGLKYLMASYLREKYEFVLLPQLRGAHGINFDLLRELAGQIATIKPDILHVRGLQSEGFYGVLAGRLAGCKRIVLSVHGFYSDVLLLNQYKRILFGTILEPLTLWNADVVYCVCEYACNRPMIRRYARNLQGYIHNVAPDFSSISAQAARQNIRAELNIPPSNIVAISVGRVTVDKGFKDLETAIQMLAQQQRDLAFLVVGEGDYLNEMKRNLHALEGSGRVFFTGSRTDVPAMLLASDIFVLPTLHENLSNALLEAGAAAIPSVTTAVGGNPEVVVHGETGILVPPHRPQQIAEAVRHLAESTRERRQMGANALRHVRARFGEGRILHQVDEVYQRVLRKA